jgi:uncharacterized protein (TIGR02596 family)
MVELLVVIAIVAILASVSLPAITAIKGSYNLDSVGQNIASQLTFARQTALASSHPVEVRFYQIADYSGSTTNPVYRAMQTFEEADTGTVAISKPYFFPSPIVILNKLLGSVDASGLLDYTNNYGIQYVSAGDSNNPVPGYGAAPYVYFRFRSNGQVDQSNQTGNSWSSATLTLASENAPLNSTTSLPNNYATIQLNAITGAVRVFRP